MIKHANASGNAASYLAKKQSPAELLVMLRNFKDCGMSSMLCVMAYHQSQAYWLLINGVWYRK